MHKLSVCALFKNEAHCIKEWLDHYIFHGVEHFYLLDDESDDNYYDIIKEYIDAGQITLFKVSWPRYLDRQHDIYNNYMFPLLNETQWLLMCDLDEFVWSQINIDLKVVLEQCNHLAIIQIVQTLFGSNGFINQPESLVKSFTKRRFCQFGTSRTCGYKYFINTNFPFKKLYVHYAIPENKEDETNRWLVLSDDYFIMNHYCCQSKDFFLKKCERTDVNEFKKLTLDDFQEYDVNEIEDTRLYMQNKEIIDKI
jgi:hypothetical protein